MLRPAQLAQTPLRILLDHCGIVIALVVIAIVYGTRGPIPLKFKGGTAQVVPGELKTLDVTTEFSQATGSSNKSIVIDGPSPKEQVFLPIHDAFHIPHRHRDLVWLKLRSWAYYRLHFWPFLQFIEIQSGIGVNLSKRIGNLANESFGRRASTVCPEILNIQARKGFPISGATNGPYGTAGIYRSSLVSGIQLIGIVIDQHLKTSEDCQQSGKDGSDNSRTRESFRPIYCHVIWPLLLLVVYICSFVGAIVYLWRGFYCRSRSALLCAFLFSALCCITFYQLVIALFGGFERI